MDNTLYYGDNLDILRRYVKDASVDLVYLDPPFNSNQNYNVLFKEQDGDRAASQIRAFEDTWTWDQEDEAVYAELVMNGGKVADVLQRKKVVTVGHPENGRATVCLMHEAARGAWREN